MKTLKQNKLFLFLLLFTPLAFAADNDNSKCQQYIVSRELRENRGTVTKLYFHVAFLEINLLGKKMNLILRPDKIEDLHGTTWAANGIREGSHVLVKWIPYGMATRVVHLAKPGSAPAQILSGEEDSRLTLETTVDGRTVRLTAPPEKIVEYRGERLTELGLHRGTWVWVKWNPETGDVESIVP